MSSIETKVITIKKLDYGDDDRFIKVLIENNQLLAQGWEITNIERNEIDRHDQREGNYKEFVGYTLVYARLKDKNRE